MAGGVITREALEPAPQATSQVTCSSKEGHQGTTGRKQAARSHGNLHLLPASQPGVPDLPILPGGPAGQWPQSSCFHCRTGKRNKQEKTKN